MSKSELLRLVEESGFIFRGKVVGAAEAHALRVEVEQVLRSSEALSGFAGREVIVVSERGAAEEEGSFFFFTRVVSVGDRVLLRGLGRMRVSREAAAEVSEAVRSTEEQPLRRRLTEADLVVTGRVVASRPAETPPITRSEHDPEWHIARVEVLSVLKGAKSVKEIEVLFANSTDIAWYKAPKLHERASGILILRRVRAREDVPEAAHGMYEATDPLDFLPLERLEEVERLLGQERGNR